MKPWQKEYWIKSYDAGLDEHNAKQQKIRDTQKNPKFELKRRNPEHDWLTKLFRFGLLIEAISIVYFIGFSFYVEDTNKEKFVDTLALFEIVMYIIALLALLTHQMFIRNTFMKVNEITTHHWNNKDTSDDTFFPHDLMFSSGEYRLRILFFISLSLIVGEIPYLLVILDKIVEASFGTGFYFTKYLTQIFLASCSLVSLIVMAWNLLVLSCLYLRNKTNSTSFTADKAVGKVLLFTFSGFLSLVMWLMILFFGLTTDDWWMKPFNYVVGAYIGLIFVYRVIWLKTNPFTGGF